MTESDYRDSVFLDSRIKSSGNQRLAVSIANIKRVFLANGQRQSPLTFIFHTGHCGSTLLSRALDFSGLTLPLREPRTLNSLSNLERELGHPVSLFTERSFKELQDTIISAISRNFHAGQRPVVKATSTCNNLVRPLMESAADSRALLLHQTLERHVAGRVDSKPGVFDLLVQSRERMLDWMAMPGTPKLYNARLAAEQLAVISWMTSMYYLTRARGDHPERTQMIDFDVFLQDPHTHLSAITDFLNLDVPGETVQNQYTGISMQYSKLPGQPFTAEDRRRKLDKARAGHQKRVTRSMHWAEQLVRANPALEPLAEYFQ